MCDTGAANALAWFRFYDWTREYVKRRTQVMNTQAVIAVSHTQTQPHTHRHHPRYICGRFATRARALRRAPTRVKSRRGTLADVMPMISEAADNSMVPETFSYYQSFCMHMKIGNSRADQTTPAM